MDEVMFSSLIFVWTQHSMFTSLLLSFIFSAGVSSAVVIGSLSSVSPCQISVQPLVRYRIICCDLLSCCISLSLSPPHHFIWLLQHILYNVWRANNISHNELLCCEGCSLLIISGSLLAMLTGGQRSPWCEVVSLLKFAFISSSIGSIGTVQLLTSPALSKFIFNYLLHD